MKKEKKERRYGKFSLSYPLIEQHPEVAKKIMGHVIVLRAEAMYCIDAIEYQAESDLFAVTPKGSVYTDYQFESDGHKISVTNLQTGETKNIEHGSRKLIW